MFRLLSILLPMATPAPGPISPVTNAPDNLTWLGPAIAAAALILVAVIQAISAVWKRRVDKRDKTADNLANADIAIQPRITDGWEEVRAARAEATKYYNLYRAFENLYYIVIGALRHLVRSAKDAHPETVFEKDITDALAAVPPDTADIQK